MSIVRNVTSSSLAIIFSKISSFSQSKGSRWSLNFSNPWNPIKCSTMQNKRMQLFEIQSKRIRSYALLLIPSRLNDCRLNI